MNRTDLVEMLVELGYENAAKWDEEKINEKLAKLPGLIKGSPNFDVSSLTKKSRDLLESLMVLPKKEDSVDTQQSTKAAPAPAAPEEKAKPEAKKADKPAKAPAPAKKADKPAEEKAQKVSRFAATAISLAHTKKWTTMADAVTAADKNYVEQGGKANPKEAVTVFKMVYQVMNALGLLEVSKEGSIRSKA